jgi:hypothetical protein
MSLGGPSAHTPWWHGLGLARATIGCGWPLVRLLLFFGLRLLVNKLGTLAFVSPNSENISCVNFLKHKNRRKQGTGTVHLVNRLVPENALKRHEVYTKHKASGA